MGLLKRLFRGSNKPDRRTPLEKSVDRITSDFMTDQTKKLVDNLKVPSAQALSVLLFTRLFTKGLREFSEGRYEAHMTSWPFPHDRVFVEVAAFYWFMILNDAKPRSSENAEQEDDEFEEEAEDAEQPVDPYLSGLKTSLDLCGSLVNSLTENTINKRYLINRANSYFGRLANRAEAPAEKLAGYIVNIWNASHQGAPTLAEFELPLAVRAFISDMPLDAAIKSCRDLYNDRARIERMR